MNTTIRFQLKTGGNTVTTRPAALPAMFFMATIATGFSGVSIAASSKTNVDTPAIDEVIVTAQKRTEDAQSVPLAVSVIGSDELTRAGAVASADLAHLVPGFEVVANGPFTMASIRGIGGLQVNAFGDPTVAYNVDGVVQDRAFNASATFFDVNRIEILKGPQGTLYGRNATAGAVNVITNNPVNEWQVSAAVEAGNYRALTTTGMVNIPVSATFALRAAFHTNKHNGYFSNGYNDEDNYAGRLKALWTPDDVLSLLVNLDYFHARGRGYADAPQPFGAFGQDANDPWNQNYYPPDGFIDNTYWGVHAELNWDLGFANLTAIPGFRETRQHTYYHQGGTWTSDRNPAKQTTTEIRLGHDAKGDDKLTWVAGVYFFRLQQQAHELYMFSCFCVTDSSPDFVYTDNSLGRNLTGLDTTSYAVFTQGTYALLPELRLTVGGRYTHDKKSEAGVGIVDLRSINVVFDFPDEARESWQNFSWRVGLDYDLTADSLLYASISSGYKAGGLNEGLNTPAYKPEKLVSYAIGSKNTLFDRRLRLNTEVFYWDYKDHQVATTAAVEPAPTLGYLAINIPKSKIYGIDIDALAALTAHDQLGLSVEWLHSDTGTYVVPTVTGVDFISVGAPLPSSPRWNGTLSYAHTFELGDVGTLVASTRTHAESRKLLDIHNKPLDYAAGVTTSDVELDFHANNDHWSVGAFVRNVQDRARVVAIYPGYVAGPRGDMQWAFLGAPRTFGARGSVRF